MEHIKLVYIISDIDKALAFEWIALGLKKKFDLSFIIIGKRKTVLSGFLEHESIRCYEITDHQYPSWVAKWFVTYRLISALKPDIIHTHLWRANLLGLTTSWLLRVGKRVITRHHSMIHYNEYKKGRKWDRLCNWLATDIVAISKNVQQILIQLDKVNKQKIHLIHHGFDLEYFKFIEGGRIFRIKDQYKIGSKFPVVGIISRYLELKGIQYIIPAFKKTLETFPSAHLVLANAGGAYQKSIQNLLLDLPSTCYTEITFEENLAALYQVFNVFVHVPIDPRQEAFGQTYVESLASGVPSIFTLSGVAPEFIVHEENALVVPFCDSESICLSIIRILKDEDLRNRLIKNGKKSAQLFPVSKMLDNLIKLYAS